MNVGRLPISPRELGTLRTELHDYEKKKVSLSKEIGELMGSSGSFAAKTPGYSDAEDAMRMAEAKIAQLKTLLSQTTPIEGIDELDTGRVGVYSAVLVEDGNGERQGCYICHFTSSTGPEGFPSVTPRAPLAVALMGKAVGDVTELVLKRGRRKLTVVDVQNFI